MGGSKSLPDPGKENLAMDYITSLRKHIGHAPLLMVGAGMLVVDGNHRLLLLERTDVDCWGLPGGAVELGESVEKAARRETREETGLEIGEISLFGVFSGPRYHFIYPNGDEVYNISIVYLCRDWTGGIRLNNEHRGWAWFTATDIPKNTCPPIRSIVERYIEEHGTR
jgi:ADP-ribose pyrophosphatase YjhB (NUDIX family)